MNKFLLLLFFPLICLATDLPIDRDAIQRRIAPVGKVQIGEAPEIAEELAAEPERGGVLIYNQYCIACHDSGAANAPIIGDKAEWAKRLTAAKNNIQVLISRAIKGYKVMPPRGGCMDCSDEEIQEAVEYMVEQSK